MAVTFVLARKVSFSANDRVFVGSLLLVNIVGSMYSKVAKFEPQQKLQEKVEFENLKTDKRLPNIYHLFLDAYSHSVFAENIKEKNLAKEMTGFHFFKNTRSNHMATPLSRGSFMTGKLNDYSKKSVHYYMYYQWVGPESILTRATNKGYRLSSYADNPIQTPKNLAHFYRFSSADMYNTSLSNLLDLWLVRVSPVFLRQYLFINNQGLFSYFDVLKSGLDRLGPVLQVRLFERFLEDEEKRPASGQYVYLHLFLPHWPHHMNAECRPTMKKTDYYNQSKCATEVIARFIKRLKELGRYNDSIIVIHSDHGQNGIVNPQERKLELEQYPVGKDLKSRALMAIKPPKSEEPFAVKEGLYQLLDLAPTVAKLAAIPLPNAEGRSLFPLPKEQLKTTKIITGYYYKKKELDKKNKATFGVYEYDIENKDLTHVGGVQAIWKGDPSSSGKK